MTKLLEWLSCATVIFGVWFAIITSNSVLIKEWREIILFLPIISLFLFGLYAITIVLFRVFTFNNCESAAIELQQVSSFFFRRHGCTCNIFLSNTVAFSLLANRGS